MVKEQNSSAHLSRSDSKRPAGFPSRLAAMIGDSSVRAFARKAGVSDTFLRQCLAGRTEPTRTKLIALAGAGDANVEWLATGNGPRQVVEAPRVDGSAAGIDRTLLESVLAAVEQALNEGGRTLAPDRKALLIIALYEMYSKREHAPISHEEILELVSRTS